MPRKASREVVECLGAFLERNAALSPDVVRARLADFHEGRMRVSSDGYQGPRLARPPTLRASIGFPAGALEAVDAAEEEVQSRLTHFAEYIAGRVEAGELPSVDLPDLHRTNAIYDRRGDVFLGRASRRLAFDRRGAKALLRVLLTLEAASSNLRDGVRTTKRGLYYSHRAQLPDASANQVDSDRALVALANILGVRRKALGFVEAPRGFVHGRLVIRDGGEIVDLSKAGPAGHAIPRYTDDHEIMSSDAALVLIIEKHSVASRLAHARWWETARCILVCGEGFPSLSTREYVCKLVDTLGIPAVICVDADPAGVQLALTYAHGSISTALETPWLACDNVWWAGVHPSDIDRHCRPSDAIRLTDVDRAAAQRLLEHPSGAYVNGRVREELAFLLDRGVKVELDAISRDLPRLVDDYLPKKLFESELVRL